MASTTPRMFHRWELGWDRTWAYRLFQKHHHQINTFYWAHVGAFRHTFGSTAGHKESDHVSVLFKLPAPNQYGLDVDLGTWAKQYNGFDNWVRLNALVAITGYLEVYLKTVIRAALESDPGLIHGASRAVDGVVFLKVNPQYSFKGEADKVMIGDWNSRIAQYERYFGSAPTLIKGSIGTLEELRSTRNGVTHTFGRATDDYDSLLETAPKPFKKVSQKKLVNTLAFAANIARQVDTQLGEQHVGDYEALYFYHKWDKAPDARNQSERKRLAEKIGGLHSRSLNWRYFQELIDYYNSLK